MKYLNTYEEKKEEILGTISTDTASIIVTGNPKSIKDEYNNDTVNSSTGSDGSYNVIKRWYDYNPNKEFGDHVPDEIVIKIK